MSKPFDELDRANQMAAIHNLTEFRGSFPGEVLLEHVEKLRTKYTAQCVNACGATSSDAVHLKGEAVKAAAKLELIRDIFDHESFGITA